MQIYTTKENSGPNFNEYCVSYTDDFPFNFRIDNGWRTTRGDRWSSYLYATIVLALCLIICLIGGAMFARTSIFILCVSNSHQITN